MRIPKVGLVKRVVLALGIVCLAAFAGATLAQQGPVSVQVQVMKRTGAGTAAGESVADASNVVVWLTPLDEGVKLEAAAKNVKQGLQLVQRNKSFEPHVLVLEAGSAVEFPNKDPYFHNVFSLFDGKRFDLGLYESGTSRTVHFDRVGVSFLFCNIHPEMSAVVVAVGTPYYGLSDRSGRVTIADVPNGHYRLQAWYERSLPEDLKSLDRMVTISDSARSLEAIQVIDNANFKLDHKNKYGQDYVPLSKTPY